ncbi:P-loop containing nucleoside triphosphate hydrolase protein [Cladochytrium replicatum]|nr:P-loop containing nucleoside triphosphate hydrolase protein [Cladochytrium replicatum]
MHHVDPHCSQVVVGSGGVGKSCLTVRFLKDEFTNDYDPTIEENYRKSITVDNQACVINIIDTAGQQEYTSLRGQHLKDGKGFLLVCALNDRATFEEIEQLREQIFRIKDTKRVPIIVCGNKCDLPQDQLEFDEPTLQTYCTGAKVPYFLTSAKENINVSQCFEELVKECRRMDNKAAKASAGTGKNAKKNVGGGGAKKKGCNLL